MQSALTSIDDAFQSLGGARLGSYMNRRALNNTEIYSKTYQIRAVVEDRLCYGNGVMKSSDKQAWQCSTTNVVPKQVLQLLQ